MWPHKNYKIPALKTISKSKDKPQPRGPVEGDKQGHEPANLRELERRCREGPRRTSGRRNCSSPGGSRRGPFPCCAYGKAVLTRGGGGSRRKCTGRSPPGCTKVWRAPALDPGFLLVKTPWQVQVIYKRHTKGFSLQHFITMNKRNLWMVER